MHSLWDELYIYAKTTHLPHNGAKIQTKGDPKIPIMRPPETPRKRTKNDENDEKRKETWEFVIPRQRKKKNLIREKQLNLAAREQQSSSGKAKKEKYGGTKATSRG
jgi:hypothetical protein